MARAAATTRTPIATPRSAAAARSVATQFRIPVRLIDLGVTHLLSWRGGFAGSNPKTVQDDIGNISFVFGGASAISAVYNAGEYSADLELSNSDYFLGQMALLPDRTNFSMMSFVKRETDNNKNTIFSQWDELSGTAFLWRYTGAGEMEVLTTDGVVGTFTSSVGTFGPVATWQSGAFTKSGTTMLMYQNGLAVSGSGSCRNTVNGQKGVNWRIGGFLNASGNIGSGMDGRIGLTALAFGRVWTPTETLEVHTILNALGRYI